MELQPGGEEGQNRMTFAPGRCFPPRPPPLAATSSEPGAWTRPPGPAAPDRGHCSVGLRLQDVSRSSVEPPGPSLAEQLLTFYFSFSYLYNPCGGGMSGFLYRGRHCAAEKRVRPKSVGPTMDVSRGDVVDRAPAVQMHSLREFEQHLNDLKKENFSLKLRIYFLEEKIQQKFEESSDGVHKRNIELKVEVESLKKELEDKQQLLDEALLTADSLSNQNEAELQRRLAERQHEICHMQEILETKVQLLQEEAELARGEAERMASLADVESRRCLALEREMVERTEQSGGAAAAFTQQPLADKDRAIEQLTQEKLSLRLRVEELEVRVHDLSSSVGRKGAESRDDGDVQAQMQRLMDEQQDQLSRYESGAGRCVSELQEARLQVRSLQATIREGESGNQKLQQRLGEMELELRSAREEAQQQERSIQNIADNFSSKEAEAADLYTVIEEQNKMLCSLKELVDRHQLLPQVSGAESARGPVEVLALQASLFQAQLELQAGERSQRQAARAQEDLSRALQRLETDLQGALQHRRETETHNQELQSVLDQARSALQEREEQLREGEREKEREREEREKRIRELMTSLQTKEQLLEDYCELLDDPQKEKRDSLLQKLRQRVRERDRALERALDEKFLCIEEKEEETRRLQLLLREKERDMERQRSVLVNNEETINSLELLLRGKAVELQQVRDAWTSVQRRQRQSDERQSRALSERDDIISQLQAALLARSQEAQDLRCSLLAQIQSAPGDVLEELKVRLRLKDSLFQEVLADRTHQAQQHQDQVQALLTALGSRDQYIQESARRLGDVMSEQTSRLQELRRQLCSGSGSGTDQDQDLELELQAAREELRLALRREKENQERSGRREAELDSLSRALRVKEGVIRDFQRQMADPSGLPLVERLTQEVQELREGLVRPGVGQQPEIGEPSSEDEDEDLNSEDVDEEEEELRGPTLRTTKGSGAAGEAAGLGPAVEGHGLTEVKQLVEQKRAVERELAELKAQLEKCGFSSLSQMRKALISLRAENQDLTHQLTEGEHAEEDEELDVTIEEEEQEEEEEEEEEEESSEMWEAWDSELPLSPTGEDPRAEGDTRHEASSSQAGERDQEPGRERPLGPGATVRDQAEQLIAETTVPRDTKQIQVDLQDPGYETCGRSENEAEREDTSSPEFDDLEMCTSLDCGSQWWPATSGGSPFTKAAAQSSALGDEASSLQRLVEDLRSQLSRSQAVIRGLQSRLRSLSTSSDVGPAAPRKVNWCFQASQSGTEDDEGWQSSDGGPLASPRHPRPDTDLQELSSRVDALENQLRKGGKKSVDQDGKSATGPGKFDSLIQAQARELSHLRQRLREGRGVCSILTQQLGDTTKAFEELLRANDVDYYMGQSFREQLAQSGALAQRVGAKISGRDHPEDPDEKTELLAIRLSKELQQKDKIIESLRTKLNQHHPHHHHSHRSDTPCSSHALSDATDQSDRISYVSDEQGSTNEDLELCSDVDAASELGAEETSSSTRVGTDCPSHMSHHTSGPPSIASSHKTPSCLSCPSMHCPGSPLKPAVMQSQTGFSTPQSKPPGFLFARQQTDPSSFLPLSLHGYQASPYGSGLDAGLAMKAGASLLESSALWDTTYNLGRPARLGADLSSGSSGYQSGTSHAGSDLMKEHLREVRSLRQRLEDSIQTNERLRQQLEDRLTRNNSEKGAPTNIYIQGLDSVGQLSSEIRLLKEENVRLLNQLRQASAEGAKEAELLREAALSDRARLKEAELEVERWAEQSRKSQAEAEAHNGEIAQLKQDRQRSQETINRLQHEVNILQQQLLESRSLVRSLQCELQVCHGGGGATSNTHSGPVGGITFDPRQLHVQLEPQLIGRPRARRLLFNDNARSPPVRDTGLGGVPSSPLRSLHKHETGDVDAASTLQGQVPDGSFASRHGRHAVGHIDDFQALQQQVVEGGTLLCRMEVALRPLLAPPARQEFSPRQDPDAGSAGTLLSDAQTLRQILEEADALLGMFWRATLPNPEETKQTDEVVSLRLRLSEQEQALKDVMERVRSCDRTRDNMENFIVSQLSRTRDVLRKAKTNLQVKAQEASVNSPSLLVGAS